MNNDTKKEFALQSLRLLQPAPNTSFATLQSVEFNAMACMESFNHGWPVYVFSDGYIGLMNPKQPGLIRTMELPKRYHSPRTHILSFIKDRIEEAREFNELFGEWLANASRGVEACTRKDHELRTKMLNKVSVQGNPVGLLTAYLDNVRNFVKDGTKYRYGYTSNIEGHFTFHVQAEAIQAPCSWVKDTIDLSYELYFGVPEEGEQDESSLETGQVHTD